MYYNYKFLVIVQTQSIAKYVKSYLRSSISQGLLESFFSIDNRETIYQFITMKKKNYPSADV